MHKRRKGEQITVVKIADSDDEREKAILFMERIAYVWYECSPPPPPEIIFIAARRREIIGTVSLDFANAKKALPFETIYAFDAAFVPWSAADRSDVVQYGRWMASARGVSVPLWFAATDYALRHGKQYGIIETKNKVKDHLEKLGVLMQNVAMATLIKENIRHAEAGYYFLKKPPPQLYVSKLAEIRESIAATAHEAARNYNIVFDY